MRVFNFKDLKGIVAEEGQTLRLTTPTYIPETIKALPKSIISKKELEALIKEYEGSVEFTGVVEDAKLPLFGGDLINKKGVNKFDLKEVNKTVLSGFVDKVDSKGRVLNTVPEFKVDSELVRNVTWKSLTVSDEPVNGHNEPDLFFKNAVEGTDYLYRNKHQDYDLKGNVFLVNRTEFSNGKYAGYLDYLHMLSQKFTQRHDNGEDDLIRFSSQQLKYDISSRGMTSYPARPWRDTKPFSDNDITIDTTGSVITAMEHSRTHHGDYPAVAIFDGFLTVFNSGSLQQEPLEWDTISYPELGEGSSFDTDNGLKDIYGKYATRGVDVSTVSTLAVFKRNHDLVIFQEPWIRPRPITTGSSLVGDVGSYAYTDPLKRRENVFDQGSVLCRVTSTKAGAEKTSKWWSTITDSNTNGVNRTWGYLNDSFVGTGDHQEPGIVLQETSTMVANGKARAYPDYSDNHGSRAIRREGLGVIGLGDHFQYLKGSMYINDSFEMHYKETVGDKVDRNLFSATPRSKYLGNLFTEAFKDTGINVPKSGETVPRAIMSPAVIKTVVTASKIAVVALFKINRIGTTLFTHPLLKEGFNLVYFEVSLPSKVDEPEFLFENATIETARFDIDVDSLNLSTTSLGYHSNAYFDIAQGKGRLYIVFPDRLYSVVSPGGDNHYRVDILNQEYVKRNINPDITVKQLGDVSFSQLDPSTGKPWSAVTTAGSIYGERKRKRKGSTRLTRVKIATPDTGMDITGLYGFPEVVRIDYPNYTGDVGLVATNGEVGVHTPDNIEWRHRNNTTLSFNAKEHHGFYTDRGREDVVFHDGYMFKVVSANEQSTRFAPESLVLLRCKATSGYAKAGSWEVVGWEQGITGPLTYEPGIDRFGHIEMEPNQDHLRLIILSNNTVYFIDTIGRKFFTGSFVGGVEGHVEWGKTLSNLPNSIPAFSEFYVRNGFIEAIGITTFKNNPSTYKKPSWHTGILPFYRYSVNPFDQSEITKVVLDPRKNLVQVAISKTNVIDNATRTNPIAYKDYPWDIAMIPRMDDHSEDTYVLRKRNPDTLESYITSEPRGRISKNTVYVESMSFVEKTEEVNGTILPVRKTRRTIPSMFTTVSRNRYFFATGNNLYVFSANDLDLYSQSEMITRDIQLKYPAQRVPSPRPFEFNFDPEIDRDYLFFMGNEFYYEDDRAQKNNFKVGDRFKFLSRSERLEIYTEEHFDKEITVLRGQLELYPDKALTIMDPYTGLTLVPVLLEGERYGEGAIYWKYKGSDGALGEPALLSQEPWYDFELDNSWIVRDSVVTGNSVGGLHTVYTFENEIDPRCKVPLYSRYSSAAIDRKTSRVNGWRTSQRSLNDFAVTGFTNKSFVDVPVLMASDLGVAEGAYWVIYPDYIMETDKGVLITLAVQMTESGTMEEMCFVSYTVSPDALTGEAGVSNFKRVETDIVLDSTFSNKNYTVKGDSRRDRVSTHVMSNDSGDVKLITIRLIDDSYFVSGRDIKLPVTSPDKILRMTPVLTLDEDYYFDQNSGVTYSSTINGLTVETDKGFVSLTGQVLSKETHGEFVTRGEEILYVAGSEVVDDSTGFTLKYGIGRLLKDDVVDPASVALHSRWVPSNVVGSTFLNKSLTVAGSDKLTRVNTPILVKDGLMVISEVITPLLGTLRRMDIFFIKDYDVVDGDGPVTLINTRYISRGGNADSSLDNTDFYYNTSQLHSEVPRTCVRVVDGNRILFSGLKVEGSILSPFIFGNVIIGKDEPEEGLDNNSLNDSVVKYNPDPALTIARKGAYVDIKVMVTTLNKQGVLIPHEGLKGAKLVQYGHLVDNIHIEYQGELTPGVYSFRASSDVRTKDLFRFETESSRNRAKLLLINFHLEDDLDKFDDLVLDVTSKIVNIEDDYGLEYPRVVLTYKIARYLDPSSPFISKENPFLILEDGNFTATYVNSPRPGEYVFHCDNQNNWEEMVDKVRFSVTNQTHKVSTEVKIPARKIPNISEVRIVSSSLETIYLSEPSEDSLDLRFEIYDETGKKVNNFPGLKIDSTVPEFKVLEATEVLYDHSKGNYITTISRSYDQELLLGTYDRLYMDMDIDVIHPGGKVTAKKAFKGHFQHAEYLPNLWTTEGEYEYVGPRITDSSISVSKDFSRQVEFSYQLAPLSTSVRTEKTFKPSRRDLELVIRHSHVNKGVSIKENREDASTTAKLIYTHSEDVDRRLPLREYFAIVMKGDLGGTTYGERTIITTNPTVPGTSELAFSESPVGASGIPLTTYTTPTPTLDKVWSKGSVEKPSKALNLTAYFATRGNLFIGDIYNGFTTVRAKVTPNFSLPVRYGLEVKEESGRGFRPKERYKANVGLNRIGRTGMEERYGSVPDNLVYIPVDLPGSKTVVVCLSTMFADKLFGFSIVIPGSEEKPKDVQTFQFPKGTVANIYVPSEKGLGHVYAYDKDRNITAVYLLSICANSFNPILTEISREHPDLMFYGTMYEGALIEPLGKNPANFAYNIGVNAIYVEQEKGDFLKYYQFPPYLNKDGNVNVFVGRGKDFYTRTYELPSAIDLDELHIEPYGPGSVSFVAYNKTHAWILNSETKKDSKPFETLPVHDGDVCRRVTFNANNFEYRMSSGINNIDYANRDGSIYEGPGDDTPFVNWYHDKESVGFVVPTMERTQKTYKDTIGNRLGLLPVGTRYGKEVMKPMKYMVDGFGSGYSSYESLVSPGHSTYVPVSKGRVLSPIDMCQRVYGEFVVDVTGSSNGPTKGKIKYSCHISDKRVLEIYVTKNPSESSRYKLANMMEVGVPWEKYIAETGAILGKGKHMDRTLQMSFVPVKDKPGEYHYKIVDMVTNEVYYPINNVLSLIKNQYGLRSSNSEVEFSYNSDKEYHPYIGKVKADGVSKVMVHATPISSVGSIVLSRDVSKLHFSEGEEESKGVIVPFTYNPRLDGRLHTVTNMVSSSVVGSVTLFLRGGSVIRNEASLVVHYLTLRPYHETSTITVSKKTIVGDGKDSLEVEVILLDPDSPTLAGKPNPPPADTLPKTVEIFDDYSKAIEMFVYPVKDRPGVYGGTYTGYQTGDKRFRFELGGIKSENHADFKITPYGDDQDPANADTFDNHTGEATAVPNEIYVFDDPDETPPGLLYVDKDDVLINHPLVPTEKGVLNVTLNNVKRVIDWGTPKTPVTSGRVILAETTEGGIYLEEVPKTAPKWITNMEEMFRRCTKFNQDISQWDVSKVTNMRYTFASCDSYNQPLNDWDVSNVTNMFGTFAWAYKFNQPLSKWDIRKVDNMGAMFRFAKKYNQNLSSWCVDTRSEEPTNFSDGVLSWTEPKPIWGTCHGEGKLLYRDTEGKVKAVEITGKDIVITDAVEIMNWGTSDVMHKSAIKVGSASLIKVPIDAPSWTTNYGHMFNGASKFDQDLSNWNTSHVLSMTSMFEEALIFNGDVSTWDVSNVTSMTNMFRKAALFNSELYHWDVSKVTTMSRMFVLCTSFNGDLSQWDVSSLKSMLYMFSSAHEFNSDLSNWDVSKVTDMGYTFNAAKAFNQDLSSWCVSLIKTQPDGFDAGANSWTKPKPIWGTCPSG